jgi:hypothetical protein
MNVDYIYGATTNLSHMTKDQALQEVENGLEEILKNSFEWCKSSDPAVSTSASKINQKAHELKVLVGKIR